MSSNKIQDIEKMLNNNTRTYANNIKMNKSRNLNIITNKPTYSLLSTRNPEQPLTRFSPRKSIPRNQDVMRERSQMIIHPSKLSKDVPNWFKGETYKYFNRNEYQQILRKQYNTLNIVEQHLSKNDYQSNRSEISTPKSMRSSQCDVFYIGGGKRESYLRRNVDKKPSRQITEKIGSTQIRNFELPKIPLKIGKSEMINTHKPF